jgi:hypothetical protein
MPVSLSRPMSISKVRMMPSSESGLLVAIAQRRPHLIDRSHTIHSEGEDVLSDTTMFRP